MVPPFAGGRCNKAYHCTKRKDPNCTQKSIEEGEVEKQIAAELAKIEIPADFKQWALARLRDANDKEVADREQMYRNQTNEYEACVKKIDRLIDMRANEEIDEEEFRGKKKVLLAEKARFKELLNDTDQRVENWLEVAERAFSFAESATARFAVAQENDDLVRKKEIFTSLGSNYVLRDGKLNISLDDLLFPIEKGAQEVRSTLSMLESPENVAVARDMGEIYSQNPRLLRDLDSNQDTRLQRAMSYH
jgi:hypothetical protein